MDIQDLISVIIPAYNIARWLPRCLDSIAAQTYSHWEVVIVDDGSTDDTGQIAEQYARKYAQIRVIHKPNGGVSSARMRGLAEAAGEWIAFIDGDDWLEPNGLEILIRNAHKYQADISHYGSQRNLPDGRVYYYYNTGRTVFQEGMQGCLDLLEGSFVEPGIWNKLYRRQLFEGLDGWLDTSIQINEDLLVNYYLFRRASCAIYEDVCPYHYIVHEGSATTSALNEHLIWDPIRVTHILLGDCPKELHAVIYRRLIRQLIAGATSPLIVNRELLVPYRKATRRELRQRLLHVLCAGECGLKLKIMSLWATIWPASYAFVHKIYEKVTQVNRQYEM